MNTKIIIGVVLIGLLLGLLALYFPKNKATTGNAVLNAKSDIFTGKINNIAVQPGAVQGMGVYDKSCKMAGNGLTACDAGIQTKEYGVLNFQYQHNMQQVPCIAPNDILEVRIIDEQGNAEVQRA